MRVLLVALLLSVQTDWQTAVKPLEKQVPRIEIQQAGQDSPAICSGVVLNADAGFVLSAGHCFEGKPEELSITVNGRDAKLARVNRLLDLAVVRVSIKNEIAIPLAQEAPGAGTEIAIAGYLLGAKKLHVQFGRVAAQKDDDDALVLDGAALGGDSGGPVINSKGELVGMTNMRFVGTAMCLAVPVEKIRDFVEQYLPKAKP